MFGYFFRSSGEGNKVENEMSDSVSVNEGHMSESDMDHVVSDNNDADISEGNNSETLDNSGDFEQPSSNLEPCSDDNKDHDLALRQVQSEGEDTAVDHDADVSSNQGDHGGDDDNEGGMTYNGELIEFMSYKTLRLHLKNLQLSAAGKTHILRNRLIKATQGDRNAVKSSKKTPRKQPVASPVPFNKDEESVAMGTRSHDKSDRRTRSSISSAVARRNQKKSKSLSISMTAPKSPGTNKIISQKLKEKESKDRCDLKKGILMNKNSCDIAAAGFSNANDGSSEIEAYFGSEECDNVDGTRSDTRSEEVTPLPNTVEFNIAAASSNVDAQGSSGSSSSSPSIDQLDDDMVSVTATVGSTSSPLHFPPNHSRSSSTSKKKPQFVELKNSPIMPHSLPPSSLTAPALENSHEITHEINHLPNTVELNNIAEAAANVDPRGLSSSSTPSLDQLDDDMVSVTATIGSTSSPLNFPQNHSRTKRKTQIVELKSSPVMPHSLPPPSLTAPTLDSLVGQRFMNVLNDEGPQLTEKEYFFFKSFLEKKKPAQLDDKNERMASHDDVQQRPEGEDVDVPPLNKNDNIVVEAKPSPEVQNVGGSTENGASKLNDEDDLENVPSVAQQSSRGTSLSPSPLLNGNGGMHYAEFNSPGGLNIPVRPTRGGPAPHPQQFPPYSLGPYPFLPQYNYSPNQHYLYQQFHHYQQPPPYQQYFQTGQNDKKRDIYEMSKDDNSEKLYGGSDSSLEIDFDAVHQHKRRHLDDMKSSGGMRHSMGAAPMFQTYPEYENPQQTKLPPQTSSGSYLPSILKQDVKRTTAQTISNGHTPRFQENVGSFSESKRRLSSSSTLSNIQKRRMKRRLLGSTSSVGGVNSASSSPKHNTPAPSGSVAKRILDTLGVLTTSLDDQRQLPVPSKESELGKRPLTDQSSVGTESGHGRSVKFAFSSKDPVDDGNTENNSSYGKGTATPKKVYATTPYRAAAIRKANAFSGQRTRSGGKWSDSDSSLKLSSENVQEKKESVDHEADDSRRLSDASSSGQLWSRDHGQLRQSPMITPTSNSNGSLSRASYVEKLDETINVGGNEDDEFTFESPTACIEGLTDDAISGVKKRHSTSQSRRSSISFAFSPPAKSRSVSEVQNKNKGSLTNISTAPIPMPKLDDVSSLSDKKETSAPAPNSLWNAAINKVKCQTCLVPNDKGATKCVACEGTLTTAAAAKGHSTSTERSMSVEKKSAEVTSPKVSGNSIWTKALNTVKCECCLVPNDKEAVKCVACESPLPGTSSGAIANKTSMAKNSTPGDSSSTTSKFKFGTTPSISSKINESKPSSDTGSSFASKPMISFTSKSNMADAGEKSLKKDVVKPSKANFGFSSANNSSSSGESSKISHDPSTDSSSTTKSKSQFGFLSSNQSPPVSKSGSGTSFAPAASTPKTKPSFSFGAKKSEEKKEDDQVAKKTELSGNTATNESSASGFASFGSKRKESSQETGGNMGPGKFASITSETKSNAPLNEANTQPTSLPSNTSASVMTGAKRDFQASEMTQTATSNVATASFGSFGKASKDSKPVSASVISKPSFTFGKKSTSEEKQETSHKAAPNEQSIELKKVESAPFKFGSKTTANKELPATSQPSANSFNFGTKSKVGNVDDKVTSVSSKFSFGKSTTDSSSQPAKKPSFVFGAQNSSSDNSQSLKVAGSSTPPTAPSYMVDSPGSTMDMGYASGDVSENSLPPATTSLGNSFGGFSNNSSNTKTFTFGQSGGKTNASQFGVPSSSTSGNAIFGSAIGGTGGAFGGSSGKTSTTPSASFGFGSSSATASKTSAASTTPMFGKQSSSGNVPTFGQQTTSTTVPTFGQSNSFSSTPSFGSTPSSSGLTFNTSQFGSGSTGTFGSAPSLVKSSSTASLGGGGGFSLGSSDKKSERRKLKARRPGK